MKNIIEKLELLEHPEGGFFRQCFKSNVKVQPQDLTDNRAAFTHIYYYLPKGSYSRFHMNRYDEIWNFYSGAGIRFFLFDPKNRSVAEEELKPDEFKFHLVIRGGVWQAAKPLGEYALVGCSVSPGWEEEDEKYLYGNSIESKALLELRPDWETLIPPANPEA
jgi:predicted cupin superfamily sugar epimerase